MASYINKNTNDFLPDKILTESILEENPVATNVLPNPKLDEYLAVMLEGKKKYFEITRQDQGYFRSPVANMGSSFLLHNIEGGRYSF